MPPPMDITVSPQSTATTTWPMVSEKCSRMKFINKTIPATPQTAAEMPIV